MRNVLLISLGLVAFTLLTGCINKAGGVKLKEIPIMDMEKSYAKKEVSLQELGKVKYIRLETSENALLDEGMRLVPSEEGLFFYEPSGGNVVGFDPTGHLICSFNHKGQGINEYNSINKIDYDGLNQRVYLLSHGKGTNLFTFDLSGNCLHANTIPDTLIATDMALFGPSSLLVWDTKNFKVIKDGKICKLADQNPEPDPRPFALLDTGDGSISSRLPIDYPGHFRPLVFTIVDGRPFVQTARTRQIVPSSNGFLLNDYVADTVFWVSEEKEVKPVFTRTPSLHANVQKGKVCDVLAMSSRYLLVNVIWLDPEEGSSVTGLRTAMYLWDSDKRDFAECSFRNADYKGEEGQSAPMTISGDKLYFRYFPHQLVEALESGRLSGDLEELARSLKEDDNQILMEVSL